MPTTDSPSTRVTRASARRSSINLESLPQATSRARRSLCKPIYYINSDSDSETEVKDNSYRNIPINIPKERRKSLATLKNKKIVKPVIETIIIESSPETSPVKNLNIPKKENSKPLAEIKENTRITEEFVKPVIPKTPQKENRFPSPQKNFSPNQSPLKMVLTPRKKKSMQDIENLGNVTPPKQKKTGDECTNPSVMFSPSTLFKKLELNSPRKHCEEIDEETRSVYQNARKALHGTAPMEMPGREKEHEELRSFIKLHLENKSSGTLYVSGPPGTGKTASLSKILKEPDVESRFKEVYVNCTAIKSSGSIYSRIIKELGIKSIGRSEKDCIASIEAYLMTNHKMILLVLDEIDQLESKKQSVLYTIFEWPSKPDSKLVLIGIANALDLTDRILPRLQSRLELKPQLMHFAPYSKAQIVEIFTHRLRTAGVLDLFHPVAVQMLAGKVAAISGDVRRALDIGRRVIEIVEQHKRQQSLKTSEESCSSNQTEKTIDKVDLKHVVGVLNSVYGTSNNLNNEDGEDSFPLQQKIVICTLLLIIKKARNKDVTIGKLHDVYRKVCGKRNLLAVDQAEFVGLCSLIETRGIIRVSGRKEPRLHKVSLEWDDEEVSAALRDKQLMSVILEDVSVIGKM